MITPSRTNQSNEALLIGILDKLYDTEPFIHGNRIDQLRAANSNSFDLVKLIKLCEELNLCYANNWFFAVASLTRALLDHVPPIFECKTFTPERIAVELLKRYRCI